MPTVPFRRGLTVDPPAEKKAVEAQIEDAALPPEALCPKCKTKLISPETLGWCPSCGYCRSLEKDAIKVQATAPVIKKPSVIGFMEFLELLGRVPAWAWILLAGAAVLTGVAIAGNMLLPRESLGRALWGTIQLGVGILLFFGAEVWALVHLAPKEENLGFKDLFLFGRLWGATARSLPDTKRQVWMGSWSTIAMICALFVVGGFGYWFNWKPKNKVQLDLARVAQSQGNENATLEEALDDVANTQNLTNTTLNNKDEKKEELKKEPPKQQEVAQTAVIGYMVDDKETLEGLVLAMSDGKKLVYVGTVKKGFSPEASKELLTRLKTQVTPEPTIKGLTMSAIWVKPRVFCEVLHEGLDQDGRLTKPAFKDLLKDQK
jgi:hypothetical protein